MGRKAIADRVVGIAFLVGGLVLALAMPLQSFAAGPNPAVSRHTDGAVLPTGTAVAPVSTHTATVAPTQGTTSNAAANRPGTPAPKPPTHPAGSTSTPTPPVLSTKPSIILGADPGNPNDISKVGLISQYATTVGGSPRIVNFFLSWSDGGNFDPSLANAIVAQGATPMVSWLSSDWRYGTNQPAYADRQIANGAYDMLLKSWGSALGQWRKPIFIRLDDEMNGNWDAWSPGVNGNTVQDYLDMWRHVVTTMRAAGNGLPNVSFVWTPNVTSQGAASDFRPMYPGDAYVDWVGLDGYNWGTTRDSGWQTWTQIFAKDYDTLRALAPTKPLMIAETGCEEAGGDKAAWLTQAFTAEIPTRFPALRAVVYFNEDKRADGEGDWLVTTSAQSLAAWRSIVAAPYYSATYK